MSTYTSILPGSLQFYFLMHNSSLSSISALYIILTLYYLINLLWNTFLVLSKKLFHNVYCYTLLSLNFLLLKCGKITSGYQYLFLFYFLGTQEMTLPTFLPLTEPSISCSQWNVSGSDLSHFLPKTIKPLHESPSPSGTATGTWQPVLR